MLLAGFALFWVDDAGPGWRSSDWSSPGSGLGVQYPLGAARAIGAATGRSDLAATRLSLGAGLASGLHAVPARRGRRPVGACTPRSCWCPVLVVVAWLVLAVSRPSPGVRRARPAAASPGAA